VAYIYPYISYLNAEKIIKMLVCRRINDYDKEAGDTANPI
jgi:hypothetical protein